MKYDKFLDLEGSIAFQLGFLSKAVSDDETRYFMREIYIEPSDKGDGLLGVATDGQHLHLVDPLSGAAEVFGMTTGYWRVMRKYTKSHKDRVWIARLDDSETKGWMYPNWRRVIPTGDAVYETTFEGFEFEGINSNYAGFIRFIRDFPEATVINLKNLMFLGTGFVWNVKWYGHNKALKFIEGDRMALIMPMLMD